jgi:hypothetical protein
MDGVMPGRVYCHEIQSGTCPFARVDVRTKEQTPALFPA